jgi:response regulator of citrate/malate metabolism
MLTKKIADFSADLLDTVRGVLGEAKKCPKGCECEKCEAEDDMEEGYMPTADEPTDANKKTAQKIRDMMAKEKKPVKEETKEDLPFEGPYRKTGERKDEYGNKVKNVAKHLAKKAMKANEDLEHTNCGTPECCGQCDTPEQIDETAKIVAHLQKRYGDNIRKSHVRSAASDFGVDASKLAKAVRTKLGKNMLDEEDDGWYTHSQMHGSKKSEKHPKGISAAEWKSGIRWHHGKNKRINIKEEAEELDEISKATMGRYINKAKDSIDMASYRQGHKEAHGSSSKPLEKKLTKRHKGISTAVNKLTKEEAEQIDELSKGTMGRYINKAATKMGSQGVTAGLKIAADEKSSKNFKDMGKREKGIKLAVNKLTKEEQDFIDSLNNDMFEEVEITEARGRPRKAGAKDFTIHPKTKEKLMHNNPEHMKKIELLQKNRVLEKPKVEAGQHIMNQLRKAKTSMLGGSKINFTHGDSKEVSGTHAAKILTKYAGMKPDEKETFQKFVGHSHENLMKHV